MSLVKSEQFTDAHLKDILVPSLLGLILLVIVASSLLAHHFLLILSLPKPSAVIGTTMSENHPTDKSMLFGLAVTTTIYISIYIYVQICICLNIYIRMHM